MANEKWLIDAKPLMEGGWHLVQTGESNRFLASMSLADVPTVDAVEVVHGEWSTIEDDLCGLVALHCSVCNQEWWFEDDAPIKHYHYCPNCSAKMDGGNEDG